MACQEGKIPAVDFPQRNTLTGGEKIFTQDGSYAPNEQHFTLDQAIAYLIANMGGNLQRFNNHAEAAAGGIAEGKPWVATTSNTMGAVGGTLIIQPPASEWQ